jgi:GNAT superfamily N-acetyltransferase
VRGELLCSSSLVEVWCPGAEEFVAIVAGSRESRGWVDDYPTEGDVLMASLRGPRDLVAVEPWGPMQIVERSTGLVVGGIGFLSAPTEGSVEIGYGLAASARGRGLATEAVVLLVSVAATHGLHQITAHTDPDNLASAAVLSRAGFRVVLGQEAANGQITWSREVA